MANRLGFDLSRNALGHLVGTVRRLTTAKLRVYGLVAHGYGGLKNRRRARWALGSRNGKIATG